MDDAVVASYSCAEQMCADMPIDLEQLNTHTRVAFLLGVAWCDQLRKQVERNKQERTNA
jgi:hypothetical protein